MPKIIRVEGSIFDLFFGDGWKDWTRVHIYRDGTVAYKDGRKRADSVFAQIKRPK